MIRGKEVEPIGDYFPNDVESTVFILKHICTIHFIFKSERHPQCFL